MSEALPHSGSHDLRFGSESIPFSLRFIDRTHLSITVHPDCKVLVTAPIGRTHDEVLNHVRKRAAWIVKQIAYFERFHPLPSPKRYVNGETHRYLGRQYRLKARSGVRRSVKLARPFIIVTTNGKSTRRCVSQLLDDWYKQRAVEILPRYVDKCLSAARSLELRQPRIRIQRLSKRWGSCTRAGTILLNTELIRTPPYCIEYVIMHEICHLRVHDHGVRFFQLLTRCMPDWKRRKTRLDSFVG